MITIPCSSCGAAVELPADDVSPICPQCKQVVAVKWFYPKGRPGTRSYLSPFDVWRLSLIRTGRVARSA
jgi:hypothetical protein